MRVPKLRLAALALVSGIALGGCAYDMYGAGGYGGYSPYGYGGGYAPYSGVSVGVGYGNYGYGGYNPYYSNYGGYGGYGGYYGGSPFGWYDNFYYPGTGIYVYDSSRRRRVWNDTERRHWTHGNSNWDNRNGGTWTRSSNPNWSDFNRQRASGITIRGQKYYDERNQRR